jgi:hypothetical protein
VWSDGGGLFRSQIKNGVFMVEVKNFFTNLFQDAGVAFDGRRHNFHSVEAKIWSVALRIFGTLGMILATAFFFSAIGLAFAGAIGSSVFTVVGAVAVGIIAHDMIQAGQNMRNSKSAIANTLVARHIISGL